MHFLLLLFTYVIQRRFDLSLGRELDGWASGIQQNTVTTLPALAKQGWGLFAVAVVLPVLALALTGWLIRDWLFGMPYLFLNLVVLFLTLGGPAWKDELNAYLEAWRNRNYQAALLYARQMGYPVDESVNDPEKLHRLIWQDFLYQTFSRYFSVFFWFMMTGAIGALAVRLVNHAAVSGKEASLREVASRVDHVMQWFPSRLLALTFALTGNFVDCMRKCMNELVDPMGSASGVLFNAAEGALGTSDQSGQNNLLPALKDLLNRSMLVWFVVLAIIVLAGF